MCVCVLQCSLGPSNGPLSKCKTHRCSIQDVQLVRVRGVWLYWGSNYHISYEVDVKSKILNVLIKGQDTQNLRAVNSSTSVCLPDSIIHSYKFQLKSYSNGTRHLPPANRPPTTLTLWKTLGPLLILHTKSIKNITWLHIVPPWNIILSFIIGAILPPSDRSPGHIAPRQHGPRHLHAHWRIARQKGGLLHVCRSQVLTTELIRSFFTLRTYEK